MSALFLRAALSLLLPLLANLLAPLGTAVQDESSLRDEKALFHDVCFAAAEAFTRQTIVLRHANHLQQFHAQLAARCKLTISEPEFDFTSGRILFGLWSAGVGCGANHLLTDYERDVGANRIRVHAISFTFGACPYELLRPLWLSAPGDANTHIELQVSPAGGIQP